MKNKFLMLSTLVSFYGTSAFADAASDLAAACADPTNQCTQVFKVGDPYTVGTEVMTDSILADVYPHAWKIKCVGDTDFTNSIAYSEYSPALGVNDGFGYIIYKGATGLTTFIKYSTAAAVVYDYCVVNTHRPGTHNGPAVDADPVI